ncbi:LLM class flavin-dependent oxidoreductase [Methylobacterium sp. J-092]|uniref:LLM class flavin-dependent oxidoreductase n=1 Tax=Methylobacterium sp. J-092 TaxID=2836667 RepID=UPI001FB9D4EF|nr:LLM class flavin-dependent oxidoreductase [Methylobacterium sp. J-092]MCJ2010586.1 LLM class flavin-dependent oxidoreductase [Methylobacterium sp. J-092]
MATLSVLDLSFVGSGSSPAQALRDSLDLARHVDRLGYGRYWLAEHHALPSVASPAPDIMVGQIAAATRTIRVGSGGIMLPNHAPLMVAERFKVLEALFPGRIDLGLGRAPGTDGITAQALRRREAPRGGDDFLERLQELMLWETGGFPEGHPFNTVTVMPAGVPLPPIFLLGSSDYSAHLSARLGLGFAFAQHFASFDARGPMLDYRRGFQPSRWGTRPHAILAVAAVCAETEAQAERLALSTQLATLRREHGEYAPIPTLTEAEAYPYSDAERARIARGRDRLHVGTPETVRALLSGLAEATQADEIMVVCAVPDQEARRRSYSLLAQAWGLAETAAAA